MQTNIKASMCVIQHQEKIYEDDCGKIKYLIKKCIETFDFEL
jgi:hypothetical protein